VPVNAGVYVGVWDYNLVHWIDVVWPG